MSNESIEDLKLPSVDFKEGNAVIAEEQIESSLSNIEMSKSEKSLQKPLALARLADQKEDALKDKVK